MTQVHKFYVNLYLMALKNILLKNAHMSHVYLTPCDHINLV